MKKILSLGLFISGIQLSAQFYDADTWYYSFTLGGVASYLSHQYTFNSDMFDAQMKLNVSAGGNIHYRLTQDVSIFGGVYYLRAGGNYVINRLNAPAFRHFSMNYFQIPIGIQFQPNRWLFEAGGYAAYLLASRVVIYRDEQMGSRTIHLFNDTNLFDGGVFAGVGYGFQLESDAFFTAGLRYYQGLNDVFAPDFGRREANYKTTFHQIFYLYLQAAYSF
ncbi:hypothetical protein JCM31826_15720 [Thermaurantimonas aggregans]|uniref:Outer membrane protein beta-barrel domain-containing protein n=1 Tax=Thermaurantimonas aggregans TaxID=2173829 RepID=A0A401XM53_9FLAO|nr:porin family protein [Thermaurantimonas aggregans]GCD78090.1 hypothetical protein JCM31826_15720 [Thermaurantimonas aggregans]